MSNLKYDKELYIGSDFYGNDDTNISNYKERLVKVRKDHICVNCRKPILKGDYSVLETGFIDNEPVSSYTCTDCIEKWLEESGQVENGGN